jgi:hypothetical protein
VVHITDFERVAREFWMRRTRILDAGGVTDFGRGAGVWWLYGATGAGLVVVDAVADERLALILCLASHKGAIILSLRFSFRNIVFLTSICSAARQAGYIVM